VKYLVTGAAGYIGSHTVRELLARDATRVVAVDSLVRGHQGAIDALAGVAGGRLRFEQLDLRERAPLAALLAEERPDAVLHFAAYTLVGESVAQPAMYWSCGVGGTSSLIEAMRAAGTPRLVFSSTAATYGAPEEMPISEETPQRPVNPYGASKLACEAIIRDEVAAARRDGRAFAATMLRYFNVAGCASDGLLGEDHDPETHLVPSALQAALGMRPALQLFGTDYPTPDGTCIRDYVHVEDLAAAHVDALHAQRPHGCEAFNVGIGHGFSVREVFAECERVVGKAIPVTVAARRDGDPPVLVSDPARIMRELGWRPRHRTLAPMVESAWNWMRTHPQGYRTR
jgi:UDP-glucose-4-epimerase GalE